MYVSINMGGKEKGRAKTPFLYEWKGIRYPLESVVLHSLLLTENKTEKKMENE